MISANYVDGLELRIKELAAERDAALAREAKLVAQVEVARKLYVRLTNNVGFSDNGEGCYVADGKLMADFDSWSDATPTQCLRDVKAEAVRDFILWGVANVDPEFSEFSDCAKEFISQGLPKTITSDDQYAERVKAGEV